MEEKFFIEVSCQQKNHGDERVCGDVFISRRIKEEGRLIAVLSDGMGHGIKASMLAILTATLAVRFTEKHKDIREIADIIMNTLPVDSVKQMNYSTFTIVEIDLEGTVNILEYENPKTLIIRGGKPLDTGWNCIVLDTERNYGKEVLTTCFKARKEDRIIFCTDGVVQSGLGSERFPLGWGQQDFEEFVVESLHDEHDLSAATLANRVINKANLNDQFFPKDDTSCAVIYFREPRKLMICTGPPLEGKTDEEFAQILKDFVGTRIICGATTADLIAREWRETITDSQVITDAELPPVAYMEGVDLVTEGILTLSKVNEILKGYSNTTRLGKGPADLIVSALLECDEIHFIVGTKINEAHQDPGLPVDLELRRTIVHRIARVLEEKFLKEVTMRFY